ncbi:carbamoyltransferase HypF [Candidatus Latescibacterota bacterium]
MNTGGCRIESIEVTGIVQGVGFRPFVHNLAKRHGLGGYVLNTPDGVIIEVEGKPEAVERFVHSLENDAPPLSKIIEIKRKEPDERVRGDVSPRRYSGFEIRDSLHDGRSKTLIPPDTCVCKDCIGEFFNPEDRRYLYPFINCTNCGPRFTIIKDLPYDRPLTTMNSFTMCSRCRNEYEDPNDRRFHAQPNACPVCGPHLELLNSEGIPISDDPLTTAITYLKEGRILAVKGLGGFHLAVDGTNSRAVERLRQRKHREEKPLALMVGNSTVAHDIVHIGKTQELILTGRERPILLVPRRDTDIVADAVAPGNSFLGVMLPYTPLHYLLFFHPGAGGSYPDGKPVFTALIMTSGNLSEEPICKDNDEVIDRLSGIADAFLVHNRDIHVRCDDSVVTSIDGELSFMRRSRGYVPVPVFLPEKMPSVLALGAELKNTLCITEGRRAFTSQHIGDLENISTLDTFHEAVVHFKTVLELEPRIFAYDLHPEYLSTKYFLRLADEMEKEDFGAVGVQHHHAHIASVLAEHGHPGPVIGLSFDGTGYGLDGTVWGGEFLLCTPYHFERLAHLDYVPLPGGAKAIREPWRTAYSYLKSAFGEEWRHLNLPSLKQIPSHDLEVLDLACTAGVNAPKTSSLGRLFDAVASIIDLCHTVTYEGQAAMMLDMLAAHEKSGQTLPYTIYTSETAEDFGDYPVLHGKAENASPGISPVPEVRYGIDYTPLVRSVVEEMKRGRSRSELARDFHVTLMASFADVVDRIREATGVNTVALSGGCWQNRILSSRFPGILREKGYTVLTNRLVPPNDGGISLGQAFVAGHVAGLMNKNR